METVAILVAMWALVMVVKSTVSRESKDVGVLSPLQGLSALGHVTRSVPCAVICANSPSYWPALLRVMPRPSAFYGKLAASAKVPRIQAQSAVARSDLRAGDVEKQLDASVQQLVGHAVDPEEPLMAAGLDSLAAMELQNMISASMGVELPSTLVFDYPSVRAMSGFIESQMGVAPAEAPAQAAVLSGPSGPAGAHAGGPRPGRCGRRLPRQRGCDMPGAVRAVGRGRGRASRGWEGGRAVRGLYARLGPVRRRGVWHVRRGGELHGPSAAAAAGDGLGGSAVRGLARECGAGGRVRGHPAAGVQRDGGPVRRGFQPVHGDGWNLQRGGWPFVIQVRTGGAVAER